MGALSALKWKPDDDLLLKNAVEAGASLESLAKGAIHFSRRYTLKEIYDRWDKLLYDIDTSIEASARIIELEVDTTCVNPPKPNRTSSSKGREMAGKRNGDTVRSHYYALRKRICSELRTFDHSGFHMQQCLDPHSGHLVGNDSANSCGYDQPSLGYYEGIKTSDDAEQGFPGMLGFQASDDVDLFHLNVDNLVVDGGCISEYPQCTEQYEFRNMDNLYGNDLAGSDVPSISGGSAFLDLHEVESTQSLPMDGQYGSGAVNPEAEADFPSSTSKQGRLRPEFREDVNSLVSDDTNTLHEPRNPTNIGFPTCRILDEITSSSVPIVGDFNGNQVASSLSLDDDNKDIDSPKSHDTDSKPRLNLHISEGELDGSKPVMEIIEDFPRSYMDVAFLSDMDNKEYIYMNSPSKMPQDDAFNSGGLLQTGSNESARFVDGEIHVESDVLDQVNYAALSNEDRVDALGSDMICTLNIDNESIAVEGFCVLNTEDPDVPCNDHIFPSASSPLASQDLESNLKNKVAGSSHPEMSESTMLPVSSMKEAKSLDVGESGVSRHLISADCDPTIGGFVNTALHACSNTALKETINPGKNVDNVTYKKNSSQMCYCAFTRKVDTYECRPNIHFKDQNCNQSNLERNSAELLVTDPITKLPKSEQECQLSESENDVPNFSDIEAMILDMDLDPNVQDSGPFAKEGSGYQCADTKKKLIRLEQGALSCMRRAISFHGAFAVFYGRRLKYYIRTSKVSLGRATETVKVDIDLGIEGRANTISRRQAIIAMEGGSFFLTNVGKCSIFMNNREVPSDKRIKLISDCLIEIKGMIFIFVVGQNAVRRYISRPRATKKELNERFDWAPGPISTR